MSTQLLKGPTLPPEFGPAAKAYFLIHKYEASLYGEPID